MNFYYLGDLKSAFKIRTVILETGMEDPDTPLTQLDTFRGLFVIDTNTIVMGSDS